MAGNKYEFTYFGVKGFGNMVRIILEDQGIPYDFTPVTLDTWPGVKPHTPLGQIPMLTVNGTTKLGQSHTIARYLAREHGLMGGTNLEQALIDMWVDQTADVRKNFVKVVYTNYENGLKPYLETIPNDLAVFEKQLGVSGDGKHLLLSKLTLADYMLFDVLHFLVALSPDCLGKTPHVKTFYESFGAREKLHAFLNREDIRTMKYTGTPHL